MKCFDQLLKEEEDPVLVKLRATPRDEQSLSNGKSIAAGFFKVCHRQAQIYLNCNFSEPDKLMQAERVMAISD